MSDRPHIVVATPCYAGQVTAHWAESLLKLQPACRARGIQLSWLLHGSDALLTRARSELVARFLERPGATHLLFIDSDIGYEPDQVFRLLDFGAPVTAAAYPLKKLDWARMRRAVEVEHATTAAAAFHYVYGVADRTHIEGRRGFIKASFAGTGFLMIERDALLKLCAAHPELQYAGVHMPDDPLIGSPYRFALFDCLIDPETGTYLSEDFAFCRRWTDLGGEIWIDGQSRLTHVGAWTFSGDFATQLKQRQPPRADAQPAMAEATA